LRKENWPLVHKQVRTWGARADCLTHETKHLQASAGRIVFSRRCSPARRQRQNAEAGSPIGHRARFWQLKAASSLPKLAGPRPLLICVISPFRPSSSPPSQLSCRANASPASGCNFAMYSCLRPFYDLTFLPHACKFVATLQQAANNYHNSNNNNNKPGPPPPLRLVLPPETHGRRGGRTAHICSCYPSCARSPFLSAPFFSLSLSTCSALSKSVCVCARPKERGYSMRRSAQHSFTYLSFSFLFVASLFKLISKQAESTFTWCHSQPSQ